jgi:hypothetical protein
VEERVEVRFLSRRCAVLDGDPAAGHPSSVVLPTRTVLRRWLRSGIEAHMAAIIERVHQVTGLAVKAQWALVADACAQWFVTVGTALGDAERGEQEGLAFVKTPGSPLWNPRTGYVTIAHAGLKETFRIRGGCCRWHTLPAGDRCSSCVLRSCEDRDQRFREYLASRIAEAPATT